MIAEATFREGSPGDLAATFELSRIAMHDVAIRGGFIPPDPPLTKASIDADWDRQRGLIEFIAAQPDGRYVICEGPDGPLGYARVVRFGAMEQLTELMVDPAHQGQGLGRALLDKYLAEEGRYPESVGIVVWGTAAMRTHGEDVAEILHLLGVRPVWQQESRRVRGLEVVPLAELGRPRVDVTVRISGFFRDAFPNLIHLIDDAVRMVADLDEPDDQNFVRARVRAETERKIRSGMSADDARRTSGYRVFGSKPGTYGAGILPLLDERNWKTDQDLAAVYQAWGAFAYGRGVFGTEAPDEFKERFGSIVIAAKNQDNREHDIFDSDDYLQYHGGMIATIRALTGKNPKQYFGDSSNPLEPKQRDLADEAKRVFRTRVVNPKWIDGIKRHGYKGAFEMAATVDYLYGYDVTAQVVDDWMYERVTEAYVLDADTRQFFEQKNPWALRGIV